MSADRETPKAAATLSAALEAEPSTPYFQNKFPRVSVIIPAHNEAACIGPVIKELLSCTGHQSGFPIWELIVVDNASTDDTAAVAVRAGAKVVCEPVLGYGQACWTGAGVSCGELLLFFDADGAANAADIPALLAAVVAGADLVIGTRHQPRPEAMTLVQRFGNALATCLIRLLWGLPVTDLGPLRVIRRSTFEMLDLRDRSFGWTVEMQVKAYRRGARVVNVPVDWRARQAGKSKISGTVRGVIGAGLGIVGMIARLWRQEQRISLQQNAHQPTATRALHGDSR